MNITVKEEEEMIVREECEKILKDPQRGNLVHTKLLVDREPIEEYFCNKYKGDGANAAVGTVLARSSWAKRWRKGKYMLQKDLMEK